MKKIEAIIQTHKLDELIDALKDVGVEGLTVTDVRGHGREKGHVEFYRGREYDVNLIPKSKVEIVVADQRLEDVAATITRTTRTGKIGDGKIFISDITDAIRIRNDDRGDAAL